MNVITEKTIDNIAETNNVCFSYFRTKKNQINN